LSKNVQQQKTSHNADGDTAAEREDGANNNKDNESTVLREGIDATILVIIKRLQADGLAHRYVRNN
jgi:hypothetical protein